MFKITIHLLIKPNRKRGFFTHFFLYVEMLPVNTCNICFFIEKVKISYLDSGYLPYLKLCLLTGLQIKVNFVISQSKLIVVGTQKRQFF